MQHPLWVGLLEWSKRTALPGFAGIPIYHIIRFISSEIQKDDLVTRANSMAYSFFLAIFPGIIAFFTVLAYTPLYGKFSPVLNDYILEVLPGTTGELVMERVRDIGTKQRGGLLSFGFVLALVFSSNGMLTMMHGFEKEYKETFHKRTFFSRRVTALYLTFLTFLLLVASVVFVILGNSIVARLTNYVDFSWFTDFSFYALRILVVVLLFYFSISTIYRVGVPSRRKFRIISPGTILATVLSLLTSIAFSFYVDTFGQWNELYGSIGTIIVLLIWIQLNCSIVLIGFELNTSIAVLRNQRRKESEKVVFEEMP